jgi:hypothetical protein
VARRRRLLSAARIGERLWEALEAAGLIQEAIAKHFKKPQSFGSRSRLRIPVESGQRFRREGGHSSGVKAPPIPA